MHPDNFLSDLPTDQHYQALLSALKQAIVSESLDGLVISWNESAESMFGYKSDEIVGHHINLIFSNHILPEKQTIIEKVVQTKAQLTFNTICLSKDKQQLSVLATFSPIISTTGKVIGIATLFENYEETNLKEKAVYELIKYKNNLAAIVESSEDAIISKTLDGIITTWNKAAELIFGYTADEIVGQPMLKLFPADRLDEEEQILSRLKVGQKVDHFQTIRLHKTGKPIHISVTVSPVFDIKGMIVGASAIARDITEKLHSESLIWRQANFDTLTDLPNRQFFMERLNNEISHAKHEHDGLTVMFIDLDHFKEVNDSLGHDVGDKLLQAVSKRIRSCFRHSDMLSRFGGDEFVALMPAMSNRADIDHMTAKLLEKLNATFTIDDGTDLYVGASIGISIYPVDGQTDQELIKHADQAMYEAKRKGRNQAKYFVPAMQATLDKHHQLGLDLRSALANNEFVLHYQPIVNLRNNAIEKAEVLIRWNHPLLGMLSPMEFIPIAEETNLILDIGDWVFKTASKQLKTWLDQFKIPLQLSINKSPVQFNTEHELESWQAHLKEINLSGKSLIVEITESTMMTQSEVTQQKLLNFANAGIEVAIDDFGTGYSSLAYLNKFDIDYIKIDKIFVHEMSKDRQDFHLCEAMIVMAHKLGIKVVAEGVETEEQHQLLQSIHCDYGQGYYYSRPITHEAFEARLATHASALEPS